MKKLRWFARGISGITLMNLAAAASPRPAAPSTPIEIVIVSSRPDMVSGGDALVEVRTPAGTPLDAVRLALNDRDVTRVLHGGSGRFSGLVDGMRNGDNRLRATVRGIRGSAVLTLRNYPVAGPVFSGPHLTPYECRTEESGLGQPRDADCSAATRVEYFYRSADQEFKPLTHPGGPPPQDLTKTTTIDGVTVPYIVRLESGTVDRTIYRIAILDDPAAGATPWTPGGGWNRRVAVGFGPGVGTQYTQGALEASEALNHEYLSRGFAFLTAGQLCNWLTSNAVLQGETLMMLEEHFIEHYGRPKWIVADGVSGGAVAQLLVAQMYPGLLDGLLPGLAFPDMTQYGQWDCELFQALWRRSDFTGWPEAKKQAVEGYAPGVCSHREENGLLNLYRASNAQGCALTARALVYDPATNPGGARCTLQDMRANIYGRNPKTTFARKPQDNVGVQYGLAALTSGAIRVSEFLAINEAIGGTDVDGNLISRRSEGDRLAIRAAYQSGLLNSGGGGLATVPILHWRYGADAFGDIHDRVRDLSIRARLQKSNGRSDNQVIWVGPLPVDPQPDVVDLPTLSIDTMTCWLDNMAADPAPASIAKVLRNRPPEAEDSWWDEAGVRNAEPATTDPDSAFNRAYPLHEEPRLVAGAPLALDILKCQTKPIDWSEYGVPFTDEEKARMTSIFATGVCDFSQPGVEQVPLAGTYRRY